MGYHEEGAHELMPVAEQSLITVLPTPAFIRFCSSIPFLPPKRWDEDTCWPVRGASQHRAAESGWANSPWAVKVKVHGQRDRQHLADNTQVTGAVGNTCVPGKMG